MLRKKKKNFGLQGSISLLAILSFAVIILAIPITVKLVQQRQEIRKEAVYPSPEVTGYSCTNKGCVSGGDQFASLRKCNEICGIAGESPSPSPGCKGGNESCSNTGDCCGGLQCVSLPGGKFCVSPTCDEGLKRCSGNSIQECQGGVWTDIQRCDASCDPRTVSCVKTCNPGETRCVGDVLETCYHDGSGWSGRSCEHGCGAGACLAPAPICECSGGFWSGTGCTQWAQGMPCQEVPSPSPLPSPSPVPSPLPSPITPVIQPTVPLGGITVGYGLPQFGSTPESPYGFDPFGPCTDPTGLSCEFDPLLALGFGTPALGIGAGLGIGLLATSPQWAPLTYVTAQTYISTSPEWVQTGVSLGLPALELGGTALAALECNQGNQEACMAGMIGAIAYTEASMVNAIVSSRATPYSLAEEYIQEGADLISAGRYEEAIAHYRNPPAAVEETGLIFDSSSRGVFFSELPLAEETERLSDFLAGASHFNINRRSDVSALGYVKPATYAMLAEGTVPEELAHNVALIHMEEWSHGLQALSVADQISQGIDEVISAIDNPFVSPASEIDIAFYMREQGVPLTEQFLRRYERASYLQ